jgi:hypothetical protein
MIGDAKTVSVICTYHVAINGDVVGAMHDQFDSGELAVPYPFRRSQNRFKDEFEAQCAADEVREWLRCIEALPPEKKKNRSAKRWRLIA